MFQKLLWLWFKSDEIKLTQPRIRPSEVEVLMKFADWLDTFGLTLHAPDTSTQKAVVARILQDAINLFSPTEEEEQEFTRLLRERLRG